jgi:hypothetical protein
VGIAHPEHDLGSPQLGQFAQLTVMKRFGKFLEGHGDCSKLEKTEGILGGGGKVVNNGERRCPG